MWKENPPNINSSASNEENMSLIYWYLSNSPEKLLSDAEETKEKLSLDFSFEVPDNVTELQRWGERDQL